jgi:redox-sensitive bicupin YhaK (pirin superfamily)
MNLCAPMRLLAVRAARKSHPTGDPKFAVMQAFPAAISAEDADPFLMCDHFGPANFMTRPADPDVFGVGWHPHRGQDILTYLVEGIGRHADSMGNRGEFASPGMQWISVGSGIEHAEGGGNAPGENSQGFQIWVNVPSDRKMDDPRYGTVPPENIPLLDFSSTSPGVKARLLAGSVGQSVGPFETVQPVQMIDFLLEANSSHTHAIPENLDNCIIYAWKGSGSIAGSSVPFQHVAHLDASDPSAREFTMTAGAEGFSVIMFAGKRLNQPIAWHGPFVMTTDEEIQKTIDEYRRGTFLKKRAPWDYKRLSAFPKK